MGSAEALFDIPPVTGEVIENTGEPAVIPQKALITISPEWFTERLKDRFEGRVGVIAKMVASTTVESQEVADQLINSRAEAKAIIKQIGELLKTHLGETEATIKNIRSSANRYTKLLDDLITNIDEKMKAWNRLRAIREQEVERQRQAEIDAMNKKIAAEAAEAGVEPPPPIEVPAAVKVDAVQRTATGAKVSMYKRWTYNRDKVDIKALAKAVAAGKVSEDVISLNSGAIQKMIDGGVRKIAGLEIYEKEMIRG